MFQRHGLSDGSLPLARKLRKFGKKFNLFLVIRGPLQMAFGNIFDKWVLTKRNIFDTWGAQLLRLIQNVKNVPFSRYIAPNMAGCPNGNPDQFKAHKLPPAIPIGPRRGPQPAEPKPLTLILQPGGEASSSLNCIL